jgi:hypothetical protein
MSARSFALLLLALAALPAAAQTTAGQITGLVSDPSGALITGATVVARNSATGVTRQTASNDAGNYAIPLLEPGLYSLTVQKEGFRTAERSGVTLSVNSTVRLDFTMTLGSVNESVSVTADAPLLDTAESSLRTVVDNRKVVDLPLNGRNPFDLVFLAPGTQAYRRPSGPGNNIYLTNLAINGGPAMANEVLLDGIPSTSPQYNQLTVIPSIDAVQEFEVKTNNMAAEFGRTSGGVVNVALKSGSNLLHGTVYEFLRNDAFDSNLWVNNRTGQAKPPFRYSQFGTSVGGPIRKDKTFFFGNYEGLRRRTGRTFLFSVPTQLQRAGDFSQTRVQNGTTIGIYDPLSVRQAGAAYQRDLFPGNKIPVDRFNVVSKNILPYWAAPNLPGDPVTGINNFIAVKPEKYSVNQTNTRIDHTFSPANRIFGRFSWNESWVTPPMLFETPAANPSSGPQLFTQRNLAINDTHSFTPTTFATFRIGWTRLRDYNNPYDLGFDPTKLGFPTYFRDSQPAAVFPSISVNGYTVSNAGFGTSSIGPVNTTIINNVSNAYTAQSDVTKTAGRHVAKAGFEYRLFRSGGFRPNLATFTFSPGLSQGPNPQQASATAGQSFASFLLGLAGAGNTQTNATQDIQSYYYGAFVQDDYKVTPKLTLNIGFRFEVENLRTDRYNRLNVLDYSSQVPLQVPGVGQLRGGLGFVNVNGVPREQAAVNHNLSPRFGFAYQLQPRMVVRGGYGIFFAPRTGWDFNQLGQTGFSSTTPHVASADGVTVTSYYSNPFPNGFVAPTGSSQGLLTNIGGGISAPDRDQKGLYMQHWNFSVQRQLPANIALDLAYAGSKGTHVWQNLQYNQLPDQYLSLKTDLQRVITNPFRGYIPAAQSLGGTTTTYAQLLRPYPQFTGVSTIGSTSGSSTYHAFEIRADKRYSRGLNFLVAYTFNKMIDDGAPGSRIAWIGDVPNFQNNNNRRAERSLNSQQGPQRLSIAGGYELPFGRGKALGSGISALADTFIGGWQINALASFQSGIPLSLTTSVNNTNSSGGGSRPNSTGKSAALSGPVVSRLSRYFDTSAFTQPDPFTFGNLGRTLPNVRGPANVNFDLSLIKNVAVTERVRAQLRGEAFNAFNNTNFGLPGTALGAADFGVISSAGSARIIQLGLKVSF